MCVKSRQASPLTIHNEVKKKNKKNKHHSENVNFCKDNTNYCTLNTSRTYHHPVPLSRNLGTLTSWNPLGLSRSVMGLLYLYLFEHVKSPGRNRCVQIERLLTTLGGSHPGIRFVITSTSYTKDIT